MGGDGREYRRRRPETTVLYRAVREAQAGGLRVPRALAAEVDRYLGCGQLRLGFVEVRCEACRAVAVVAFSCKGRGLCPSCTTRRAVEAAAHLVETLPVVGYRQWTLSLPVPLRWPALRTRGLLGAVEKALVRAVWRWQRAAARRAGVAGPLRGGAVGFLQLFGSALQLTPHFHVLLPEGLWDSAGTFVPLPPPDDAEVEAVLHRLLRQLRPRLAALEESRPDDDDFAPPRDAQRLLLPASPRPRGRRLAVAHGFSLHADTALHPHDRQGLERLCRYGARGAVAESRLGRLDDGRYTYSTRRGSTLTLTAPALLLRLLALVPPPHLHLTRYHGVFAPNSSLRPAVVLPPAPSPPPASIPGTHPPLSQGPRPHRRPRLDWASLQLRTFGADVWRCPCGGRRRVLSLVSNPSTAEAILSNLGLLPPRIHLPPAQAPPQLQLQL